MTIRKSYFKPFNPERSWTEKGKSNKVSHCWIVRKIFIDGKGYVDQKPFIVPYRIGRELVKEKHTRWWPAFPK